MHDDDVGSDSENTSLNLAAFTALKGFRTDWKKPLVALLRSDEPLSWSVREALAEAVENEDPDSVSLVMTGHDRLAKRVEGLYARRRWYQDGLAISPFASDCRNLLEAFEMAADAIGRDDTYCRKKYYYYLHCSNWAQLARTDGFWYPKMSEAQLQDVWHFASIDQKSENPNPPSGAEFDEVRFSRIEFFKGVFAGWEKMKLAVDTFVGYSEVLPPEKG